MHLKAESELLRLRLEAFGERRRRRADTARAVIAENDERQRLVPAECAAGPDRRHGSSVTRRVAMMRSTALVPKPGTRNRSSRQAVVDIERKAAAVPQRPGELWIDVERQHAFGLVDDFAGGKTVKPHQPVGLVEPVLADQRRRRQRQSAAGVGDRAEGGVVDALQLVGAVEVGAGVAGWSGRWRRRRRRSSACSGRPAQSAAVLALVSACRLPPLHRASAATGPWCGGWRATSFSGASFARLSSARHLDVDARGGRHICRLPRSAHRRLPEWS